MIPQYRLIKHLLFLKSNHFFKREIKKQLGCLPAKNYRDTYNLIFNCNRNLMFIKMISTYLEFNNRCYKAVLPVVTNFMFIIAGLLPIFQKQGKKIDDYQTTKKILFTKCNYDEIKIWLQEAEQVVVLPSFFVDNTKLKFNILIAIKKLMHVSGKTFAYLHGKTDFDEHAYQFGSLLMLFYLLDLETRQTLLLSDTTSYNLKSIFTYETLFINKLVILDKLTNEAMILGQTNFNLYLRIMNYSLLGNY